MINFRCNDVNIRKEYVKLVEDVRDAGGEVKIFSSMHISGQRKYIASVSIEFRKYANKYRIVLQIMHKTFDFQIKLTLFF